MELPPLICRHNFPGTTRNHMLAMIQWENEQPHTQMSHNSDSPDVTFLCYTYYSFMNIGCPLFSPHTQMTPLFKNQLLPVLNTGAPHIVSKKPEGTHMSSGALIPHENVFVCWLLFYLSDIYIYILWSQLDFQFLRARNRPHTHLNACPQPSHVSAESF